MSSLRSEYVTHVAGSKSCVTDVAALTGAKPHRSPPNSCGRIAVQWKEFRAREYSWEGFVSFRQRLETMGL